VNIPTCFAAYNESFAHGRVVGWQQYVTGTGATAAKTRGAGNCVQCGQCEKHCPQDLKIMENLKAVRRRMEPFWYRAVLKTARRFMRLRG
jgi:predicted aldo/keto reductase-like oxidoreductase